MFKPLPLNLPPFSARITKKGENFYIFDILRKKHLRLTPEEWVRQHWIHHLYTEYRYPMTLMRAEGGIYLNSLKKRSDLVVFDQAGQHVLLAEFKAPSVKITEKTFSQIANYNTIYKIPLLLVSNGIEHHYCRIDFQRGDFKFLPVLPSFNDGDFGY